jgi:hypothetical protein
VHLRTDRGPNADGPDGHKLFPLPGFTPHLGRYRLEHGALHLVGTILLTDYWRCIDSRR